MSALNFYIFQFPFYAVAYGSDYANELDAVSGFDEQQAAVDFIDKKNGEILSEQYDNDEDKWKNDDYAIEWLLFNQQELRELGGDSEYFKAAITRDSFEGRYCSISLDKFIKLAFGTQKSFAQVQGVQPAQVTQWLNKYCLVTFTNSGWELTFLRREIQLQNEFNS